MKKYLEYTGFIWLGLLCAFVLVTTWSWWAFVLEGVWLVRLLFFRQMRGRVALIILLLLAICLGSDWMHRIHQPKIMEGEYLVALKVNPLTAKVEDTWRGEAIVVYEQQVFPVVFSIPREKIEDNVALSDLFGVTVYAQVIFKNPEPARNFGVFDYQNYLRNRRIDYMAQVREIKKISLNPTWWERVQQWVMGPILSLRDTWWGAFVAKMVWSANSSLFYQAADELSALGLLHLFAISGFHFMWIRRMLLRYILLPLGMRRDVAEGVVSVLWIVYGALIGWSIGAIRVVGGMVLHRVFPRLQSVERLSIVGIIVLICEPRWALQMGYVLSFGMSFLYQVFPRQSSKWYVYGSTLMTSFPIVVSMQHFFVWSYLVGGVVLTPLVEWIILPFAFLTVMVASVFYDGGRMLCETISPVLSHSLMWISQYLYPWILGELQPIWFIMWLIAWIIWLKWGERHKLKVVSMIVSMMLVLGIVVPCLRMTHDVYIIDVGQGDCLLYQPPWTNEAWLIDTGGRADWRTHLIDERYAHRNVIPALKALGVQKLTGVIITHSDLDHIGNLAVLSQSIKIDQLYISQAIADHEIWRDLLAKELQTRQITILPDGHRISLRENIHCYLSAALPGEEREPNDTSIATVIQMGELSLLNLGDLSAPYEERLLQQFPEIRADILKLAHHGSRFSSSSPFLQSLHPKLALISSGVNNRYGHPSPEVLERLTAYHIPYYSTQQQGAIHIQSMDGQHYTVDTKLAK